MIKILLPLILIVLSLSCNNNGSGSSSAQNTVPDLTFGINIEWEDLGYNLLTGGELVRDRSFRMNHTPYYDIFGTLKNPLWEKYENGGSVTFSVTGGDTPSGEGSYPGYSIISRNTVGYTGVSQRLLGNMKSGEQYKMTFSSFGVGRAETIIAYIFDVAHPGVPASNTIMVPTGNSSWLRQSVILTPSSDIENPGILIVVQSTDTSNHEVYLDEIRISKNSSVPAFKQSVKQSLVELGVKSARWPGGTLVDFFDWKSSIGSVLSRKECVSFSNYQTPSIGLHEFLNLCEELKIEPMLQVNILNGAAEAKDLVEYVLGNETTPQGAIRKANGRSAPWNVRYFEIGNEPSLTYKGSESAANTHLGYIALAKPVISAVKSKAASLGKEVQVSGIVEPSYQLADWFTAASAAVFASNPDPKIAVVNSLYYWNSEALSSSGIESVSDFLDGHYYGYREYDPALSEEDSFKKAMASGAVLEITYNDKIAPLSSKPLFITEYHFSPEHKTTKVIQIQYLQDFQSGLGIADILFSIIKMKSGGAHLYSFAHGYFGAVQNVDSKRLRPAGLAFKMLSVTSGEEIIEAVANDTESVTITTGSGNIPSNLTYPLISVLATKNAATGKPRVIILNRSYASPKTVSITLDAELTDSADIYTLNNLSLSANNESSENISISHATQSISSPLTITVPAHSLTRIDMK